ncbi:hypothetical protein J4410_00155 [Candidatus Woesearchaeota archaeon]|nr:hypothetical protein [Candidatus Woesearchaeota archaeon]
MVNVQFGASTKDLWVLEDVYPETEAERIVKANRDKIFGVVSGLMKAFSKQKGSLLVTEKEKRYEPFWHVGGKSTFEYKRNTSYSFPVLPEVIGVKINGKEFKVEAGNPEIHFGGEDHCFEQMEKEIVQSAVTGETKGLQFYLKAKKRKLVTAKELTKDGAVVPIKHRASYLLSLIVKDILKPVHADIMIEENIEITQFDLYFRPVWTFEVMETDTKKKRIVEIDAVTGTLTRVDTWTKGLREMVGKDTWFDIGAEVTGELMQNIIPGVGVALTGGKMLKARHDKKRMAAQAKKVQSAYAKKKKR